MNIKELIFAVLVSAAGIANGYFWKQLIFSPAYTDVTLFSIPAATLFLFAALFSLLALFSKTESIGYAAVGMAFAGSFFFVPADFTVISLLLVTTAGALWAYHGIRKETQLSVFFSLSKTLRHGLPIFFTALALLFSTYYFSSVNRNGDQVILPRAVFEFSLPLLQNSLEKFMPEFRSDITVDQLLIGTLRTELGAEVDISKLPSLELEKLLSAERQALGKGLGVEISGQEKTLDLLYNLANKKIEEFAGPYKNYLPYISAFGFFLAIKVLTFPMYLVALGIIFVVVKLLLMSGVLKKEVVTIQVEKITL